MRRWMTRQSDSRQPAGTVLIVTIWIVLVLAGLALVFARSMRVASAVAANQVAALQATVDDVYHDVAVALDARKMMDVDVDRLRHRY